MAIFDFFDRGALLNRDGDAFVMDGQRWRFGEAQRLSCQVAHALLGLGLAPESKVAVLSGNHPLSWLCVIGLWRAGGTWVPVNPRGSAAEQQALIDAFDVEVLFFQQPFAPLVAQVREQCRGLRHLVCIDAEQPGCLHLPTWIAGQPATQPTRRPAPDELAAIMPTGGTTGLPKGVMLTHRNLGVSMANAIYNNPYPAGAPIVNLAAAPMTHSAGFLSLPASARGGTVVVLTKPDPGALLDAVEQHRVSEFFLPPTVIYRLLDVPGIRTRDFSSLRYLMYGAAPMSVSKLKEALAVFGPVMLQGYGQTEAPGGISALRPGDHFDGAQVAPDDRLSACGLPSPFSVVAILDEQGREVPAGTSGEICVRGDIVMKGYYKQPDKTAEAIVDGWLHTGDLGHYDAQGFLHITDRKRDMIISGGFNVYPSEVEQALMTHPAVMDCAVIGVPDPQWGEAVKGVVELKPGHQASADELLALCRERLGGVKTPKSIDFIGQLPRSLVGKVLKKDIREPYWQGQDRRI